MASNGKPQFAKQIFQSQSKGGLAAAVNAAVGQDKTALTRGSPASVQPAPHQNAAQSREAITKTTRTKKHGSSKRKTVHLVLWVKPIVKAALQRIAEQEGLSMSRAGGALLERALQQTIDMHYHALLEPIIRHEIQQQMQGISNRLAFLLARTAFASEQTRAIVANILGRQSGMTTDELKHILTMTKRSAHGTLTRRNPEFEELIAAMKQWVEHAEQEPRTAEQNLTDRGTPTNAV
jgi:hypothetical protein